MAGKWIQDAVQEPGSFTRSAEKAGKSVAEYAREKKNAGGKTGRRARLALTLRKLGRKKSRSSSR